LSSDILDYLIHNKIQQYFSGNIEGRTPFLSDDLLKLFDESAGFCARQSTGVINNPEIGPAHGRHDGDGA
jgi:hypothetical protein